MANIKKINLFGKKKWLIFSVIALGLILRLIGIGFGLPNLYHADEPIIVNHALAYGSGDFNPHFFNIPPLVSYLLFLVYGLYYLIGHFVGFFPSANDFLYLFVNNPSSFYLIARILFGAILGTFTIYVLYRLVRRFFSWEHAILSALILGFNFLHVRDSHYIYVDIPLVLVLIVGFFPIFRLSQKFSWKSYLLFGCLLGLIVAIKYNGVFIVIPFLFVHFLTYGFKINRLLVTLLISLAVYTILNPFSVLDFNHFLSELYEQSRSENVLGPFHHLTYSLSGGVGWAILFFSTVGIGQSVFQKDIKKIAVTIFVISYYFVLCFMSQPYDRYVLPLIPFLAFLASDGLIAIKNRLELNPFFFCTLIFILVSPSLAKIDLSNLLFLRKDIRTVAKEWFEASISNGAKIALDSPFFMPRLKFTLSQLEEKKLYLLSQNRHQKTQLLRINAMIKQGKEANEARYKLYFLNGIPHSDSDFLFSNPRASYQVSALKKQGIEYIILCPIDKHQTVFYDDVHKNADLIAVFSPYKDHSNGPIDQQALTGGPFIWNELIARERNGQIIAIYKLRN